MASDYATLLTKDDTMRAWILQGVEKSRRTYPDFKKDTLNVKKIRQIYQLFTSLFPPLPVKIPHKNSPFSFLLHATMKFRDIFFL